MAIVTFSHCVYACSCFYKIGIATSSFQLLEYLQKYIFISGVVNEYEALGTMFKESSFNEGRDPV